MVNEHCIGVIDSDIGGLSVVNELRKTAPHHNIIYYADTENYPYGVKNSDQVISYVRKALDFFAEKNVKTVLCACSTASAVAVPVLQKLENNIKLYGMFSHLLMQNIVETVPFNKKVLLIATELTVKSKAFPLLLEKEGGEKRDFISIPAGKLVDKVTEGDFSAAAINPVLEECFSGIHSEDLGGIIIGCTHFYHIKNHIITFWHGSVPIIEPSAIVVKNMIYNLLDKAANLPVKGKVFCKVTGNQQSFAERVKALEFKKNKVLIDEFYC